MAPREDKKVADPDAVQAAAATVSISDTTIQVDDKLYSALKLAETHPGGTTISTA